jgi:hypothetical protein
VNTAQEQDQGCSLLVYCYQRVNTAQEQDQGCSLLVYCNQRVNTAQEQDQGCSLLVNCYQRVKTAQEQDQGCSLLCNCYQYFSALWPKLPAINLQRYDALSMVSVAILGLLLSQTNIISYSWLIVCRVATRLLVGITGC